jgi:hypothetical protein
MIVNILLFSALLICVLGAINGFANQIIARDHKKGRHWNHPQPETCPECKTDKEQQESIT